MENQSKRGVVNFCFQEGDGVEVKLVLSHGISSGAPFLFVHTLVRRLNTLS